MKGASTMKPTDNWFSSIDVFRAYEMGLENAIYIFEKTIDLPLKARKLLLKDLKKEVLGIGKCYDPDKKNV